MLHDIVGGINKASIKATTLTVSGGFTNNTKHIENQISIGNLSKSYLKNKILEWDSFKSTYYKNGALDHAKDYKNLLCVMNDVIPMPIYTTNENELLYLMKNLYNASPNEIMVAMSKSINLYTPLKSSIRHLFMIYKIYIEKLIEIFVQLRNAHIKNSSHVISFNKLVDRWNAVDIENDISTSSLILFFNFPPNSANIEKSIPVIEWVIPKIKGKSEALLKPNKKIKEFLLAVKTNGFKYMGFCPHAAVARFKLLLKFPIKELLCVIAALDHDKKYSGINAKCSSIIPKVKALQKKVEALSVKKSMSFAKPKLPRNIEKLQKFPKGMADSKKVKVFENYVDGFSVIYKNIAPHLVSKEKAINNIAIGINIVAKDLQNITDYY